MGINERDIIIVGGGHNGLACAAYLAKAGLDVLVLERRDILGGAAATEDMWEGYRVSSASYVVSLMPDRIVQELDLKRHGYEVSIVTPDYFVPFPDGTSLTLWGDVARDAANIAKLNRHDADAYAEFDRYFEHIGGLVRELLFMVPPNMRMAEVLSWARTGARFRGWTGRDIHELVRLFTMSAADFLDEWFDDPRVKGTMATQAVVGAWGGPDVARHGLRLDAPLDRRGRRALRRLGLGEGRHGRPQRRHGERRASVRRHDPHREPRSRGSRSTRRGRAVGVELEDGSLLRAKQVVSNAHPITTYLDLVGREHLSADVVRDVERFRTRSGSVKVNVALSELPVFPSWDQDGPMHKGLMAISPSMEYLEHAFDDAKYGKPSQTLRRGDVPDRASARGDRAARQAHDARVHAVHAVRHAEHRERTRDAWAQEE